MDGHYDVIYKGGNESLKGLNDLENCDELFKIKATMIK